MTTPELQLEEQFIEKFNTQKYGYGADISDRAALETNVRTKFDALNRGELTEQRVQSAQPSFHLALAA